MKNVLMTKECLLATALICSPFLAKAQSNYSNTALSQNAKTFIDQYWTEWSGPNETALPYIQSATDDQINFLGKTICRAAFMQTQAEFAQKWPNRQYKMLDGSEIISCDAAASTCNESGIVSWTDFSPRRGELSFGSRSG